MKKIALILSLLAALQFAARCQNIPVYGNLTPSDSGALDLGRPSLHWDTIFVDAIYPPVSGSGIWSQIDDSTILWTYGGDSAIINANTGTIYFGSDYGGMAIDPSARINFSGVGAFIFEGSTAQQAQIRLREDEDNGTNYVQLQSPASLAADYTLTFPANDGNANQIAITNGSGVLSWVNQAFAYYNDSTIIYQNSNDTITVLSYGNHATAIGTQGTVFGIGTNIAESNILMYDDSIKLLANGFEIMLLNNSEIKASEHFLPNNNGIQNLGSASNRWGDGLINNITTYGIVDEGSTVNTTAGDAATINAISGRFRKDATGATFTLTNSYITANSIVVVTPANAAIDATATTWTVSTAGGNVVVTFNAAPTANFDMNFIVIN